MEKEEKESFFRTFFLEMMTLKYAIDLDKIILKKLNEIKKE